MISIIVPTYNEQSQIKKTLADLAMLKGDFEVIIADGHSSDNTIAQAQNASQRSYILHLVTGGSSRAQSMNIGAQKATGDWLLFLHADCVLEKNALLAIERLPENVAAGAFSLQFDNPHWFYFFAAAYSRFRSTCFKIMHGDQGIFIRKALFKKIGGYRDVVLMEDVYFSRDVRKKGKISILPEKIITSVRRIEGYGKIKATLRYFLMKTLFFLHVPPKTLDTIYRSKSKA